MHCPYSSGANCRYPTFGMGLPGRKFSSGSEYRFGFNGKENDMETGTQDYGMRIYDTRLGKFLSVDPLTKKYAMLTPYQFASNTPVCSIDLDGLEGLVPTGVGGQGMIIRPQQADQIKKQTLVALFKANFSEALPKKLIEQYANGNGKPIVLNKSEVVLVRSQPTGIKGIALADNEKFDDLIKGAKPGSVLQLPNDYAIQSQALTGGTLGRFTIKLEGKITFDKKEASKWTFEGTMQFIDTWDFNTVPVGEKDLQGNDWRDTQTDFAKKYLPGQGFDVSSEKMPVKQNSGEDTFDWYEGKPINSVQGRASNFISDYPTEGGKAKDEIK